MTQPEYVPIATPDRVRPAERLPPARSWRPERPGDTPAPVPPKGAKFGSAGPDLGYGLLLAHRFEDRLKLEAGESAEDAIAGCFGVGARRASTFGRAPVIYDMEFAFTLWGFLGAAPRDLIGFRRALFAQASHHYWEQREIVDRVNEEALRLTPAQVRDQLNDWKRLIDVS